MMIFKFHMKGRIMFCFQCSLCSDLCIIYSCYDFHKKNSFRKNVDIRRVNHLKKSRTHFEKVIRKCQKVTIKVKKSRKKIHEKSKKTRKKLSREVKKMFKKIKKVKVTKKKQKKSWKKSKSHRQNQRNLVHLFWSDSPLEDISKR